MINLIRVGSLSGFPIPRKKIPIPGIKNPRDISKVKNPESRGFCENPEIKKISRFLTRDFFGIFKSGSRSPEFRDFLIQPKIKKSSGSGWGIPQNPIPKLPLNMIIEKNCAYGAINVRIDSSWLHYFFIKKFKLNENLARQK